MAPQRDVTTGPSADVVIPSDPAEARNLQEKIERLLQDRPPTNRTSSASNWPWKRRSSTPSSTATRWTGPSGCTSPYRPLPGRFEVAVTDEGPGFDPTDVPDCTAPENLERPSGRGLMLMRHYMTQVDYNDRGNGVIMHKEFPSNGRKK